MHGGIADTDASAISPIPFIEGHPVEGGPVGQQCEGEVACHAPTVARRQGSGFFICDFFAFDKANRAVTVEWAVGNS